MHETRAVESGPCHSHCHTACSGPCGAAAPTAFRAEDSGPSRRCCPTCGGLDAATAHGVRQSVGQDG
eukprot:1140605-Pelagomonas_calceolata.AAC.1